MLEATRLECRRGNRLLFKDLELHLRPGGLLRLRGANGSGKTSLLRMLCGLLLPGSGEIRWGGARIQSLGEDYYSVLTYIGHRPGLKDDLSAAENLQIACELAGTPVSRLQVLQGLERLRMADQADLPARSLSEGQRRRVTLTRLFLCRRPLWLLDEVTASLDHETVGVIEGLIGSHLESGGMAVIASHQDLRITDNNYEQLELGS